MNTYVALLRGVNLGPRNKLPMPELAKMFAAVKCDQVRTYIQSGNVVFCAASRIAAGVSEAMQKKIRQKYGFEVPVVLRSAEEMKAVVRDNPYAKRKSFEEVLHVMFLADRPEKERVKGLDPNRSAGDEYIVQGREIYLWLPNGVGRSKLSNAYFDSKLATVSTGRNWRTVLTLAEMADANLGHGSL